MINFPAFCNSCGAIFPSGFAFENSRNITLSGCQSQCPKCGAMAHIPDGIYNFVDDTIEILSGSNRTIEELKRFAFILHNAKNNSYDIGRLKEEVDKEVPELSSVMDILPKTRQDLYQFIQIIIAIIGIIITLSHKPEQLKIEVNQVFNNIYQNNVSINYIVDNENINKSINRPINTKNKIGRNEKCPCGSGKKYKHCHGSIDN